MVATWKFFYGFPNGPKTSTIAAFFVPTAHRCIVLAHCISGELNGCIKLMNDMCGHNIVIVQRSGIVFLILNESMFLTIIKSVLKYIAFGNTMLYDYYF